MGIFSLGSGNGRGLLGHGAARAEATLRGAERGPGGATAAAQQVDIDARRGVVDWTVTPYGVEPVEPGGE